MGKRCPYCRQIIAEDNLFCPNCGKEYPKGKTCSSCGAAISDNDVYCQNCGVAVTKGKACPHCGAAINDGDVFCQNCGEAVDKGKACPHCHGAINEDDLFCQNCGTKLNKGEVSSRSDDSGVITEIRHDSQKVVETNPTKTITPLSLPTECESEEDASDDSEEQEEISPKKYGKWIVISLIAIALIGGGVYFFLNRSSNEQEDKEEIITNGNKTLCGTIGEYPITMELHIDNPNVDGSMYYNKYGPSNKLFVSGSLHNNEIELTEHNKDGMETGRYKGKYSNGVFQGKYTNYKGDVYSFNLSEAEKEKDVEEPIVHSEIQAKIDFLDKFYIGLRERGYNDSYVRKYITNNAKKVLNEEYDYDCFEGDCLAVWMFEGWGDNIPISRNIKAQDDNHFIVENKYEHGCYNVIITVIKEGETYKIDDIEVIRSDHY